MLFTESLNRNEDFQRLYRRGAFCSLGSALLYVMPNRLPYNRLGITAGKKIGNAVKRNRAKRIIRAAYSAAEKDMPIGVDIVVVARSILPEQNANTLTDAMCTRGVRHVQGVSSGEIPLGQPKAQGGSPKQKTRRIPHKAPQKPEKP